MRRRYTRIGNLSRGLIISKRVSKTRFPLMPLTVPSCMLTTNPVFSSGFLETNEVSVPPSADRGDSQSDPGDELASEAASFSSSKWTRHFEDSDDEDDEVLIDGIDHDIDEVETETFESAPSSQTALSATPTGITGTGDIASAASAPTVVISEDTATVGSDNEHESYDRNVRPKLSHPSSPRGLVSSEKQQQNQESGWHHVSKSDPTPPGPSKSRVVVKDVAYTTYRGVLYYVRYIFTSPTPFNES